MVDSDLAYLFEKSLKDGDDIDDIYRANREWLKDKYIVKSGLATQSREKPDTIITISGQRDFIECAVEHLGFYMDIRSIQDAVNLSVFLELKKLGEFIDCQDRLFAAKEEVDRTFLYDSVSGDPINEDTSRAWWEKKHEPGRDDRFWLKRDGFKHGNPPSE